MVGAVGLGIGTRLHRLSGAETILKYAGIEYLV